MKRVHLHIHAAGRKVATVDMPSAAQAAAGNYRKWHTRVAGLDIAIENRAGSYRKAGWPPLSAHYGYFKRTEGADGDEVDVYVRPGTPEDWDGTAYVIDQTDGRGGFDEHKVMIGWPGEWSACRAYLANFDAGWQLGPVTAVPVSELREWLAHGDTRVAFADSEYDDLIDAFLRALADVQSGATADEEMGHPFHGNQYTGGLGAKPETVKEKGVKSGVHELLSSGHPFTMEELQKITGASTIKQISDALAMLKNPKYAGSKGTLEIVKTPQGFAVKPKAQGAPAPTTTDPDPEPEWEPYMSELPAVPSPAAPAVIEPPKAPEAPVGKSAPGYIGPAGSPGVPPETPMSKADADKHYAAHIEEALWQTAELAKTNPDAAALHFKGKKATAMAQWKANTTGTPIATKKQEVFEADKALVASLLAGTSQDKALADWKKNTSAEKMGNFPPKAPVNAMPKPSAPKAEAVEKHAPKFDAVADYVPADHAHVGLEDFAPKSGAANGTFAKQIGNLKTSLANGHPDAVQNKLGVQAALESRLADSPAFQSLQAQYKKKGGAYGGSLAAVLISTWASTSGDSHPISIANQISVREAFKMDPDSVSSGNMGSKHSGPEHDEGVFSEAATSLGCKYDTPEAKETFKAGLRDFALAQYHNTQDHLKQLGITEVCVVRGMKIGHGSQSKAEVGNLKLQPISSFSANYGTAKSFAGGQTLYFSKVPASQVFSSYVTGFGCSNEHEVVVLAHPEMKAARMPSDKGGSMSEAAGYIHSSLGGSSQQTGSGVASSAPAKPMALKKAQEIAAKGVPIAPAGTNVNNAHKVNQLVAAGDLQGLKTMQVNFAGKKVPKTKAFIKEAIQHLEAKASMEHHAAPKATAPAAHNIPAPPHNGELVTAAYEAAQKGDLAGIEKALEDGAGWQSQQSKSYIESLHDLVQNKGAGSAKAQAAEAIKKAQAPVVPHVGPAPAGHALHSHYDPAEYEGWVAKGYSTHQLGKKLAMKKFLSKKVAT